MPGWSDYNQWTDSQQNLKRLIEILKYMIYARKHLNKQHYIQAKNNNHVELERIVKIT